MLEIVSINVGTRQALKIGRRDTVTGIYKHAVDHPVEVTTLGITGDAVCDTRHHGGPDQAVYIYRIEDYEFWSTELGKSVGPGTFGDNLCIKGIPSPALMVGDRIRFEKVLLEVTAPRIPCSTLSTRMGDAGFVKAFLAARRPGFYCRVISPGKLSANERGVLEPSVGEKDMGEKEMGEKEMGEKVTDENSSVGSIDTVTFFDEIQRKLPVPRLRQYLKLPIDERSRAALNKQLATQLDQRTG